MGWGSPNFPRHLIHLRNISRGAGRGLVSIKKILTKCLWLLNQHNIISHNNRFLKISILVLGPIQKCLETFSGFPSKTTMKAYTKLIVVMCSQIFGQRSPAPSSSDFLRRLPTLLVYGRSVKQLVKEFPSEKSDLFFCFVFTKQKTKKIKFIFFLLLIIFDHNYFLTFFRPFFFLDKK